MLSKARLKELSGLKFKKGRIEQGKFLIEGLRLCEAAAESSWAIETVLLAPTFGEEAREKTLLKKLQSRNIELIQAKNQDIARLSETVTAQGIICVVKTKHRLIEEIREKILKEKSGTGLILALDSISDPGNAGTLIRTADAFGVDAVLLSRNAVELYNSKVIRASMGSIFHLPVFDGVDLQKIVPPLKKNKFRILSTHVDKGKELEKLHLSGKVCLLLGSEAEGLDRKLQKLADEIIHIPTWGKAESLNVAVAGGILLHGIAGKLKCG
jgi:TrmH family RNA methyltransferase